MVTLRAVEEGASRRVLRVALICMPFYGAAKPSIQLGLLRGMTEHAGHQADTFHFSVDLAARLTPEVYEALCDHRGRMTGDWLFSVAAFGDRVDGDDETYFAAFPEEIATVEHVTGKDRGFLSELRQQVLPRFVEECLAAADWGSYDLVGFSSTFQQNVASLALARRIKERFPHVRIIFGGANFEEEMGPEYVRAFPFIDYAVVGEGDVVFPALLRLLASGQEPEQLPGLVQRRGDDVTFPGQAPAIREMDSLPAPVYDEYYERAARAGVLGHAKYPYVLPFESSRGCWWGEKHHCTFCGLNGLGLAYRAKRPERVLAELAALSRKHRVTFFEAVDNILDMKYVKEFFSAIEAEKLDYTFFYEVKANLTPEQVRLLYRGGVRSIQPGIESLSTHVLQLMRKGCTMLQNVRLLRWARYYGMGVGWNLIHGFPGETEEDYRRQLEVCRLITHLQPPAGCGRIWLERFSPYFVERDQFPVHNIRPEASYAHVYPAEVRLDKVAYFFDYDMDDTAPEEIHGELRELVKEWQEQAASATPPTLTYRRTPDCLLIDDNRGDARRGTYAFDPPLAPIYEFCSETMRTVAQVSEHVRAAQDGLALAPDEVEWALEEFCRRGLMLGEDGKYLSLALPANPNFW